MLNKQKVNEAWADNPYRENWYALFAAIVTDKSPSRCINELNCQSGKEYDNIEDYETTLTEEERRYYKNIKDKDESKQNEKTEKYIPKKHMIKITNIKNNRVKLFKTKGECAKYLGIKLNLINEYIKNEYIFNDIYKIENMYKDMKNRNGVKCPVKIIDLKENKEYEFNTRAAAAKFLGCKAQTITNCVDYTRAYKKRWVVEELDRMEKKDEGNN